MPPSSLTTGECRLHDAMRPSPAGAMLHPKAYPRSVEHPSYHLPVRGREDGAEEGHSACSSPIVPLSCHHGGSSPASHGRPGRPLCSPRRAIPPDRGLSAPSIACSSHTRAILAGEHWAPGYASQAAATDARMLRGGCTSPSDSDIRRRLASNFGDPPTLCGPRQWHPRTTRDQE